MRDHLPLTLLLLPWAAAALSLLLGLMSETLARWTGWLGLTGGFLLALKGLSETLEKGKWHYALGGWAPPWGIEITLSPFACFLSILLFLIALCSFFFLRDSAIFAKGKSRFFTPFFLGFLGSLMGLLLLKDALGIYLFFEGMLICAAGFQVLFGEKGLLDSFRILLWGSLGGSLMLLGWAFLYASTGTLHLGDLLAQLFTTQKGEMALLGGLFLSASLGVLLLFPLPPLFTRWIAQTPPALTGFLSASGLRVGAYLLFIFIFLTVGVPGAPKPLWVQALERLPGLVLLGGFWAAAKEKDFRRLGAWLSAAQLAFPLFGMALGNKSALTGTLVELVNQLLVTAGIFFIAAHLKETPGAHPLSRLAGMGRHRILTGLCLVFLAASIVGVPPTLGFFGKFYLIQGALEAKDWFTLGALGIISLLNLFSFLKLMVFLYERRAPSAAPETGRFASKAFLLMTLLVLGLGIFHENFIRSVVEPTLPKAFLEIPMPNVPFLGREVE